MWIDTHAHIGASVFADDLDDVLARAQGAGVNRIVCVADTLEATQRAVALADLHSPIVATAGIHAHNASEATADALAELRRWVEHPKVVAVGEIGLDFHYDFAPVPVQQEALRQQVRLACEVNLPIILHSRKAEHAVLDVLADEGIPAAGGVLHCFWGDQGAAQRALDMGLYIGVGGAITFKTAQDLRDLIRYIPSDRLLVETDSPYLAPVPYRGKRNEPAYVANAGRALAEVLGQPADRVARLTSQNASHLFGLDVSGING